MAKQDRISAFSAFQEIRGLREEHARSEVVGLVRSIHSARKTLQYWCEAFSGGHGVDSDEKAKYAEERIRKAEDKIRRIVKKLNEMCPDPSGECWKVEFQHDPRANVAVLRYRAADGWREVWGDW